MVIQVKKWGNSLGIRFPMRVANQLKMLEGTKVDLVIKNNKIEIVPVEENEYSLEKMLKDINGDNIHNETDTGSSVGREL
jgi:antitoxin MazE